MKVHLLKRSKQLSAGRTVYYWTLRWHDKHGRARYKSIGRVGEITHAQAKREKNRLIVDIGTGKVSARRTISRMPLSAFIDFHEVQFGHGKRPATIIEWRIAGRHAIAALGDKLLEEVTWSDAGVIRSYLDGRSSATIRKTLVTLKGMFNRAAKRDMIYHNPFANEELDPPTVRPKRIYSPDEIDAMIEAAPSSMWKALILLAVTSGLRKSELLHLRWNEDVDLEARTVRVQGRTGIAPILPWQPKTAKSTRTVPIPAATVEVLMRLQMQSDGSPYLFDGKNFDKVFRRILAVATGGPRGCFHDLRKTFGTRAATAGVPMHELQAHLGHSQITTTAEYYTAIEDSAADRLRKVFERVA